MALVFGKASDFILDEPEVQGMYENIKNGADLNVELEGTLVKRFEELLDLEQSNEDLKLQSLLDELIKYQSIEQESQKFLDDQFNDVDRQIQDLLTAI